jgi:hypothetical protein
VSQSREDLTMRALGPLMEQMRRDDALGEATFAAMETVISLMRAEDRQDCGHSAERIEFLRQALASARATVVAAGYALATAADTARVSVARDTRPGQPALPTGQAGQATAERVPAFNR